MVWRQLTLKGKVDGSYEEIQSKHEKECSGQKEIKELCRVLDVQEEEVLEGQEVEKDVLQVGVALLRGGAHSVRCPRGFAAKR